MRSLHFSLEVFYMKKYNDTLSITHLFLQYSNNKKKQNIDSIDYQHELFNAIRQHIYIPIHKDLMLIILLK